MKTDLKKLCAGLYAAFVVTALMQLSFDTMTAGGVAMMIAVTVAHMKKKAAKDTQYESHITWLTRTFWIGTGVYLPILTVVACFIIYSNMDFAPLMRTIESGQMVNAEQMETFIKGRYGNLMLYTTLAFSLPFLAWWLWRCWKGYMALRKEQPVDDPMSWL